MALRLLREFGAPLSILGFAANFGYHHSNYIKGLIGERPQHPKIGSEDYKYSPELEKNIDDFCDSVEKILSKYEKKTYEFGVESQGDFAYADGEKRPTGKGAVTAPAQGYRMIGEFKNGQLHGKGKIIDKTNNLIYKGIMTDGILGGVGVLESKDELKYVGEFVDFKPKGAGKYEFADGRNCIVKPVEKDGQHDFALCYDINKTIKYQGDWENGNFNGKGVFYFSDGRRYEGDFKDGKMQGYGKLFDSYGDVVYRGDFEDEERQNSLNNYSEPLATAGIVLCYILTRFIP